MPGGCASCGAAAGKGPFFLFFLNFFFFPPHPEDAVPGTIQRQRFISGSGREDAPPATAPLSLHGLCGAAPSPSPGRCRLAGTVTASPPGQRRPTRVPSPPHPPGFRRPGSAIPPPPPPPPGGGRAPGSPSGRGRLPAVRDGVWRWRGRPPRSSAGVKEGRGGGGRPEGGRFSTHPLTPAEPGGGRAGP